MFQTSESCIKLHAVVMLELLLSEQCPLLQVCVCVCVSTAPGVCPLLQVCVCVCPLLQVCVCVCVSTAPGVCVCVCVSTAPGVCPLLQVCVCVCPLLQVCVCVCVCPLLQVCVYLDGSNAENKISLLVNFAKSYERESYTNSLYNFVCDKKKQIFFCVCVFLQNR